MQHLSLSTHLKVALALDITQPITNCHPCINTTFPISYRPNLGRGEALCSVIVHVFVITLLRWCERVYMVPSHCTRFDLYVSWAQCCNRELISSKIRSRVLGMNIDSDAKNLPHRSAASMLMLTSLELHVFRSSYSLFTSLILSHFISSIILSIYFFLCVSSRYS